MHSPMRPWLNECGADSTPLVPHSTTTSSLWCCICTYMIHIRTCTATPTNSPKLHLENSHRKLMVQNRRLLNSWGKLEVTNVYQCKGVSKPGGANRCIRRIQLFYACLKHGHPSIRHASHSNGCAN